MRHVYDMAVIGGGPAGYTAAMYAARAGLDAVVAERLAAGGQMALTAEIDNYPGFDEGIDGFALGEKMRRGAERFGAKTVFAEVISAELSGGVKTLHTTDGELLSRTVVISAGADPRRLGLPGEEELTGKGVHYCAHCDGGFYKGKTVVVVGGGNSAAADTLYLSKLAERVMIVHRRDRLRADKIYHEPLLRTPNVSFFWNSNVTALLADERLRGVELTNALTGERTEMRCDGLFISIGRTPATAFLGGALALDESGCIIADENAKTSVSGVFAAGDIRAKHLRQIVTAVADGAVAADSAAEYLSGEAP